MTPSSATVTSVPVIASHVIAARTASVSALAGEMAPLATLIAGQVTTATATEAATRAKAIAESVVATVATFSVFNNHRRTEHVLAILGSQCILSISFILEFEKSVNSAFTPVFDVAAFDASVFVEDILDVSARNVAW